MKKYLSLITAPILGFLFTSGTAMAALPAGITTGLTTIQSDASDLADLVWPVVLFVFGALVLFKLFKRFGNKI